ncbi:hypothetical protein [Actinacidiphila oryziradicis]|jgi:hypothetical protein|uniref:hypothetical protein n=1 Tax=Actinacidiphila oryziradicis TaxID=2571141 RepID=UPI0023F47827|nr:hypothetical protein [Actinacidiphila oryziradicis]MCW2870350.1 hypothetical protein [Actinacidiphila oryziradicis]
MLAESTSENRHSEDGPASGVGDEYGDGYQFAVDDSATRPGCDLWFALPPGFVDIPYTALLAEPDTDQAHQLLDAVHTLLELVPQDKHEAFLAGLAEAQVMSELLRRQGTVHCSMGLHEGDDGALLHSVLTIMWLHTPWTPPKLGAAKAALALESADTLELADLPCGPAAITESLVEAEGQQLFRLTGYLPHPDGRRIAVLTLSTTAVSAAGHYRDILSGLVRMVSFDNPLPQQLRDRIPESEVAASVRAAFG